MSKKILITGLLLFLAACDSADFSVLDYETVVELTLVANEPVPQARLSRIIPENQSSDFEERAITNAEVVLSTGSMSLLLEASTEKPGVYEYIGPEHIIQPGVRYDLKVTVPGAATTITGTTNVPTVLEILSASPEAGTYLSDEQLTLIVTPGRGSDQTQSSFTLVTEALDVREDLLVPSAAGFLENDSDLTLEDFRLSGSPIITEGNFLRFPDGTIELVYPWIGVNFYGHNVVYVNSLDRNLSDFVRSAELQQGGEGTFGPGVIPNAIPTLYGAHGLFGSLARDKTQFTVFPPEE